MDNNRELEELRQKQEEWEKGPLKEALEILGERKGEFTTESWIPVKRVYTPLDLKEVTHNYVRELGFPGEYPYTRGATPLMYRSNLWLTPQYSGFASPEEANKRYKYLIEHGGTAIGVALDLPTQAGYDSDHPMARGEVGKVGVPISSLKDLEILFDGIPLDRLTQMSTTANSIGPIWLALSIALGEKQGLSPDKFCVRIQNDVLKEYVVRGTYIFPPKPSIKFATDAIEYCSLNMPHWIPIYFCGLHVREAGATAPQELAFILASAITTVESVINRGMDIDSFLPHANIIGISARTDLFEQVAEYRASRRLWARIMKERFGAKDPRSLCPQIIVYTAGSTLTAQQPLNNIARATIQTLAAAIGGVQIIYVSAFDEALQLPTEEAAKVAMRTSQIIAHESGVANTVDPLGGSYYVETLTNQIEEEAMRYIKKIDAIGGAAAAIEEGFIQNEIARSAYKHQMEIASGERVVVGINKYQEGEEVPVGRFTVNAEAEKRQIERLKTLRQARDKSKVEKCLQRLKEAAATTDENLVPYLLDAVRAYATIGEICDVLRDVFGVYRSLAYLPG